ncbi:DNA methyltransferase [Pseudomonas phage UF_RH7]|nr:DNA methyltransferase [Pseudomonas phage UF_RH7]
MIDFGSVCSGIEAASLAWHPLGFRAAWLSEIEEIPSAILAERFPDVPNYGDMTCLPFMVANREIPAPAILVGGTPCQAYSIAGLREGLNDPRGQLTLTYVKLANEIDHIRLEDGKPEVISVWENVPGVLSDKTNAFGCLLAGLAGADDELEPSPRPESGRSSTHWRWDAKTGKHVPKWANAGCVYGPQRAVAWRILDAQYFGLAQRRRRVFVVASARKDIDPAQVLFEFDGVRRDLEPSRETGEIVAALTSNGVGVGGADDNQARAGHLIGQKAFRLSKFGKYEDDERSSTVQSRDHKSATDLAVVLAFNHQAAGNTSSTLGLDDISGALNCCQTPAIVHAFQPRIARNGRGDMGDIVNALTATAGETGKGDAAPCIAYCIPIHDKATRYKGGGPTRNGDGSANGLGIGRPTDPCPTIDTAGNHAVFSMAVRQEDCDLSVRRLMPVECERLQGMPDGWTKIPYKKGHTSDASRYKAVGNSMAVNVMRWIGVRILTAVFDAELAADEL